MKKKAFLISILLYLSTFSYAKDLESEQLRLMYDSFIFSKDLENAYKIANRALQKEPNSYFWNQKMSEIALWTGRHKKSIKHLINIYEINNDHLIADEIIKRLTASYQYEKALQFIIKKLQDDNYSELDVEKMHELYDKVGRPKESIKLLEKLYLKNHSLKYLSDILSIYLRTGEIKKAEKIVEKLQRAKRKDAKIALAISEYYFVKKDLDRSYLALIEAKDGVKILAKNRKYFEKISDLGWYLQEYESGVYGSLMLYESKVAREVDYQRIAQVYKNSNSTIMKNMSLSALKQHNNGKFFIDYAQRKVQKKEFEEIDFEIKRVLKDKKSMSVLKDDSRFWLVKASVDKHFKRDKEADKCIKNTIFLKSNSPETISQTLWYLINNYEYKALGLEVEKVEKSSLITAELYHPLSASYLALQKPDIAIKYLKKSMKNEPKNLELRFLYASILASQGKEKRRRDELKKISKILNIQAKNNPNLKEDKKFLRRYLEVSLDIFSSKKFLNLLKISKDRLTKKDYKELQIAYTLKYKKYETAYKIQKSMIDKNPITQMEIARLMGKTEKKTELMRKFSYTTPKYMKIESAEDSNKMHKATKLAEIALKNNQNNQFLRDKLNTLNKNYGNKISIDAKTSKQGALKINTLSLNSFYYLSDGLGFLIDLRKSKYKDDKLMIYKRFETNDISAQIGLRRHIYNGNIELSLLYRDAQKGTIGLILNSDKKVNDELHIGLNAKTNSRVEDASTYLLVGGKKHSVEIEANYKLTSNQTLLFLGEYHSYYTTKNEKVGSGTRGRFSWSYGFETSPSTGFSLFYTQGNFSENNNTNSIKKLLPMHERNINLIEEDSQNIGVGFNFADNSYHIGTSLQPYFNLSALYSSIGTKIYTDIDTGFKGSFSKNDMYKFEFNYLNRLNNLGDEKFGVNFTYSRLF